MGEGVPHDIILVVEDDAQVRTMIARALTREGYDVTVAACAAEARSVMKSVKPNLILLDLGLPGEKGLDFGRWIKNNYPAVGVIIVSGQSKIDERITGLDSGADDYVAKPFAIDELLARIRATLRRVAQCAPHAPASCDLPKIGDWTLDPDQCALFSGTCRIRLTRTELLLLRALISRPNRAASREWLLDQMEIDESKGERAIDYHVHSLRTKLSHGGIGGKVIASIRGIGYAFAPAELA